MNLRELVGKKVVRTKPNRRGDYSYCDIFMNTITVVEVIDDTPVLKFEDRDGTVKYRLLDHTFDDDNWKDITKAIEYIDKANGTIRSDKVNDDELLKELYDYIDTLKGRIASTVSLATSQTLVGVRNELKNIYNKYKLEDKNNG